MSDDQDDLFQQVTEAYEAVQHAIERLLSTLGETSNSILTDYVIVAASQGFDDDGSDTTTTHVVSRERATPEYRIKGLLIEGLDMVRHNPVILLPGDLDDE